MLSEQATTRHKTLVFTIVVVGVLLRLIYLADSADDPSAYQPLVDSRTYHELAIGLAEDGVLDEHFLWQAPLYPLLLAGVYRLLGVSLLAVKLLQIFLAGGTILLTIRLGCKLYDEKTGLLAGAMVALCGPLLFFDLQLLATGLAVFWMVALANLALQVRQQAEAEAEANLPWASLGLGLVGALAILTRPTFLPIVSLLLVWPVKWQLWGKRLGLALAGLLIILVPFALEMQNLTGHTGLMPPSGAINLYIGNNQEFDETISIRTGLPWEDLIAEPMRHGYQPGPWNGQDYFRGRVLEFVTADLGEFLVLLVRKTTHLLSGRELPRNLDMYGHRQYSDLFSVLVFKIGAWGFPMALLWPLAAIGLMAPGSRKWGPLLGMLLGYAAALILVFIASRYRAPLVPLLCILAANGLMWMGAMVRQRNWRSLVPASAIFVGMTLLATLPGPFVQEKNNLQGELHYGVGWNYYQLENWSEAEKEFRQAVLLDETLPEAHNFLALVLTRQELWDEAMHHFDLAVQLNPDYSDAVSNLKLCRSKRAEAHYRQGRAMEAGSPGKAIEIYEGILAFHPDWPEVSVRLAWMLSTGDDPNLRDGTRAVQLLAQPSLASVLADPYVMYVQSAALAEAGNFEDAIAVGLIARGKIDTESRRDLANQLDQALVLFKAGKSLN